MLALLRYRRLIVPLIVLGVAAAAFGAGPGYLAALSGGLRGQDAATQLRFREFANALALIRDYPVFGVGFGDAPSHQSPDRRIERLSHCRGAGGADRPGALSRSCSVSLVTRLSRGALRAAADDPYGELTLAVGGGARSRRVVAATLDHYFFNLGFPHMAAIFWTLAGLGEVALRLTIFRVQRVRRPAQDARFAAR